MKEKDLIELISKLPSSGEEYLRNLFIEAFQESIKEALKGQILEALRNNPEAKKLLNQAVKDYMRSKALEAKALILGGEAFLEALLSSLPPETRKEIYQEIASFVQQKLKEVLREGVK